MPKQKYPKTEAEKRLKRFVNNRRCYHELHPDQAETLPGQYCSPAWRRKRIKIIVEHKFLCDKCGQIFDIDEDSITVRRKEFEPGDERLLCDIPESEFETICRECSKPINNVTPVPKRHDFQAVVKR